MSTSRTTTAEFTQGVARRSLRFSGPRACRRRPPRLGRVVPPSIFDDCRSSRSLAGGSGRSERAELQFLPDAELAPPTEDGPACALPRLLLPDVIWTLAIPRNCQSEAAGDPNAGVAKARCVLAPPSTAAGPFGHPGRRRRWAPRQKYSAPGISSSGTCESTFVGILH